MISLKFVLALSLFSVAITHGASIYSNPVLAGQVSIDGDEVICGGYTCPKTTTGCVFKQQNNHADPKMVDVIRRCVDETGGITDESVYQFEAKNGEQYNSYVSSGTNGNNIIMIDEKLDAGRQKEFERAIKQMTDQVTREVNRDINSSMSGLQRDLQKLSDILKNI